MKNELMIFENPEFGRVRTMEIDGEPYFVGKDVAEILGYANTKDAISKHVDEEDKTIIQRSENATFEIPNRGMTVINESGLYSLIFSSKLPKAKEFKHWVTSEVLPALRKTGKYEINRKVYVPTRPLTTDDYMDAARTISKCNNRRLSIVLDLYRKAGLDIPKIENAEIKLNPSSISKEEFADLLKQYSIEDLTKKLNLDRVTIWRYRTGMYKPREPRLHEIVETLTGTAEM